MNWDEKADDYAVAHHTYEHMTPNVNAKIYMGFVLGARWQRDQLRTDEAVERVALWLTGMLTPFEGWPTNEDLGGSPTGDLDTEFKHAWMDEAGALIRALIGEEPRP